MKNPHWKREELILALDLYFKLDYGQMHGKNPAVVQLSQDLQALGLHTVVPDPFSFRSVNSVSLKLANFKKLDRNFAGSGMRDGAKHDLEVWQEFQGYRDGLKSEAERIRRIFLHNKEKQMHSRILSANNADFAFQIHKHRETDPLAIQLKMEMVLADKERLKCEVCTFDPTDCYGELGRGMLEIHYTQDPTLLHGLEASDMEDFCVVCSNCHQILNKHFNLIDVEDLRHILESKQ
ncbi:hypothetical protein [Pontibacter actiniarum]|uniref:HNH domain-containing protein n=1 Tax=Pontibacter actiniarum TaxID=323450 RepID=A0A1X9YT69_9BACT|nr:hypothetical protein [Pontibacter actiniarum]ARS36057.1 hypothetical protein CA264_11760 [Pontibacter actiniarum]